MEDFKYYVPRYGARHGHQVGVRNAKWWLLVRADGPNIDLEQPNYDEPGLQYLCAGYKKFFLHIRKYLRAMATLLENGLPASRVMEAIKGPLVIRLGE